MNKTIRATLLGAVGALLLSVPASATETLRIAGSLRPGSMMDGIIQTFITNFNAQSGDDYKIAYQLVGNDQEMTQQVIRGRLEIGTTGLAGAAVSVPAGAVLSMPYLWDNDAQRRWVIDHKVRPVLEQIFADSGLVVIGLGDAGWSNIFCKTTCTTPDDIKGQRFRVPPAASARAFWQQVGVNGVQLSLPEFFTGIEQGMVEGGDLPLTFFVTTPAAEFAKTYVLNHQYHHEQIFFANKKVFDGLPPEIQALLKSAMPSTDEMRARQDADEKVQTERFEAEGGQIVTLTPEQLQLWADKVGNVHDALLADLPPAARVLYDAVQEGKAEYARLNP